MKKNIYDKYLFKTFEEHSRVLKKTQIAIKNGIKLSSEIIVKSLNFCIKENIVSLTFLKF